MVGYPDETLQYTSHATQQTQDTNLNFAEIQVSQDDHIATSPSDDNQGGTSEAVPSYETVHTTATNDSNSSDIIFPPENLNPTIPARCFLELFSGRNHRFSSYIRDLGIKTLQPFDILLDNTMNILDNDIYHSILRLIASKQVGSIVAAPPCTEYSMLKLQQPGPLPCRTPECMDHPLYDTEECFYRFHSSREIICRTVRILELQHIHGGYAGFEQPLSAMTWKEPAVQEARKSFLTETAIISHCQVMDDHHQPLNKHWQFVSDIFNFHQADLQCTCSYKHESFAGKTDDDGSYASSLTAEYPQRLVKHLTPFLRLDPPHSSSKNFLQWAEVITMIPSTPTVHFNHIPDGAGLVSSAIWPLPFKPDVFRNLRKQLEQIAFNSGLPQRLPSILQQKVNSIPFDEETLQKTQLAFQNFFQQFGPIPSFDIVPGQPFRLAALHALAKLMEDPDQALIPLLKTGVDLGVDGAIPPSGTWPGRDQEVDDTPKTPSFELFDINWQSAEGDQETLHTLIQQEIQDGFVVEFGTLEQAKIHFGDKLAIGKLGIAKQQPTKPRLVLDSTISGLNPVSQQAVQEKCSYPKISHLQRCISPMISRPCTFFNLDVKSAHKRIKVKPDQQGLLAFQFQDMIYHYQVLHFGGTCSAYYWTRLAALFLRFWHQLLYIQHFALVFVDDFIFGFDPVAAPLQASTLLLTIAFLNIPLSWHKLELGHGITWIGWCLDSWCDTVSVPEDKRNKLISNLRPLSSAGKFRRNDIEMVAGNLLWISDIFPYIRWSLGTFYSILSRPGIQLVRLNRETIQMVLSLLDPEGKLTGFIRRPFIPQGSIISRMGKINFVSGKLQNFRDNCFDMNFAWATFWNCRSNRVQIYEHEAQMIHGISSYLQDCTPRVSLSIPYRFILQAGADAYANENLFGLGAWLTTPQRDMWVSMQGNRDDVPQFFSSDSLQKLIITFETMAQALLLLMFQNTGLRGICFQISSKVDNQASEAIIAQGFTQLPIPLRLTQTIQRISFRSNVLLQPYRCTSQDNVRADNLSRGVIFEERSQDQIPFSFPELFQSLFPD